MDHEHRGPNHPLPGPGQGIGKAGRGIDRAKAALRMAMGMAPEAPPEVAEGKLPENKVDVTRDKIVALALQRNAEMVEASQVAEVVELEVDAQGRSFRPRFKTFAAAANIHARPVPRGVTNGEYRPGATSIEMLTELAGSRTFESSGLATSVLARAP